MAFRGIKIPGKLRPEYLFHGAIDTADLSRAFQRRRQLETAIAQNVDEVK